MKGEKHNLLLLECLTVVANIFAVVFISKQIIIMEIIDLSNKNYFSKLFTVLLMNYRNCGISFLQQIAKTVL